MTDLSINSGVVNIDCSLANKFILLLDANVTLVTATNIEVGTSFDLKVTRDGANAFTVTGWDEAFDFRGKADPIINTSTDGSTLMSFSSFDGTTLDAISE